MKAVAVVILASLLNLSVGCTREPSGEDAAPNPVLKVAVEADGSITLDGRDASLADVRAAFSELAKKNGAVWYYRANGDQDPPENAMLVIQAIVDEKLPISMSSKPDFSDVVLADGSTRPR